MKFLIVGDSHTQYFGLTNQVRAFMPTLRGIKSTAKVVSASTVSGVGKLDSTLALGENIKLWKEQENPDFLVLNLGQVDVELGLPFRQFVQGSSETPEYWLDYFVEKYFEYLVSLELNDAKLIVKGINLPVLCYDWKKAIKYISRIVTDRFSDSTEDAKRKDAVVAALNENYMSDILRTDLARSFNLKLKKKCDELGFGYFDINEQLTDSSSEMIHPRFIPSKFDHHVTDSLEVRLVHWKALLGVARNMN
ncbi:hypothetical protein [Glutamicibacter sp. M10]|uniref:hypothetical protein n=1 Tax=Glutamicibacter sp. M10 TaxID=3023076 RepID=UPI0021C9F49D|nr:hypothetical protein [Glutamicibacter sp. M10]UXN31280.1 hypothetical protein N6V40_12930 [Glutamicibacter sp. M10]